LREDLSADRQGEERREKRGFYILVHKSTPCLTLRQEGNNFVILFKNSSVVIINVNLIRMKIH
jgi:hypothetical protein